MILFFCPAQARAHTNFSHCSHFVGCDQFSVIWPLWFPPHQFLCCVRVQQCCHVYTGAQHFQPFLRNMNFWLWLVKHNHRQISIIINYTTKWLNVMRFIYLFIFTLQSNKWKGKKMRNWCHNYSEKLLSLPRPKVFVVWEWAVISPPSLTTQCFTNSVSVPPQHRSYYSDNKRASVMFYKIGYVFLICQWLRPWRTSFWLSNERLKNINVAEQDKKKEPYSKSVSHSLHILLFVWCRYWVSSEKSGLHSPRMAASVW